MKVLLDHNIPIKMCPLLAGHDAFTAREMSWDRLRNGDLLKAAESENFTALLTADQSIFYQQNNRSRLIALVVLSTNDWAVLRGHLPSIQAAIGRSSRGSFERLTLP